jgi:hypothetical protein
MNFGVVCRLTVTLETHDKLFNERSSIMDCCRPGKMLLKL